jgi:hypothetical protein
MARLSQQERSPVRAIFGYFGVAVLEDAGYEIHEATKNWRG